MHRILEFNLPQWLELLVEFNRQKRTEAEKMEAKMEKHCTNYWTMSYTAKQ